MSKHVGGNNHPETKGGAAGHGPGRGGNKLAGTTPDKYGTRPSMPGRPVTHMPPPRRPNDTKKDK